MIDAIAASMPADIGLEVMLHGSRPVITLVGSRAPAAAAAGPVVGVPGYGALPHYGAPEYVTVNPLGPR